MELIYLSWDSQFFSKKIYKLHIESNLSTEEMISLKECGADLVYLFALHPTNKIITLFDRVGACLYDKKVTYIKPVFPHNGKTFTFSFESIYELTPSVEKMAYQSGAFSRFKRDPKLSSHFQSLYHTWIKKSLKREIADEVIAAKYGNREIGFISLSIQGGVGKIGLIAVDEDFRGLKVGSQLLAKAEQWFSGKAISFCEVVTQLDNIPACSLYSKNGFNKKQVEYIYHYWK